MQIEYEIWKSADCADYLRVSRRQFSERTKNIPSFPEPLLVEVTEGSKSLRWKALDVINWAIGTSGQARSQ